MQRRTLRAIPLIVLMLLVGLPSAVVAAPSMCLGQAVTIMGTAGKDTLTGTAGPDVIDGRGGFDEIHGEGGNDLICGGGGIDHLHGGAGGDRLDGGSGSNDDWLFGGPGPDVLLGGCSGEEGELLKAGAGDDRLMGEWCGRSAMTPGPGDDEITARSGSILFLDATGVEVDLAEGTATGQGRDRIEIRRAPERYAHLMKVVVVGSPGDDRLFGSGRSDSFEGGGGTDLIKGRGGDDFLTAAPGPSVLSGGAGADRFYGGEGNVGRGGRGDDTVVCDPLDQYGRRSFDGGSGRDSVEVGRAEAVISLAEGTAMCSFTYESMPPSTIVTEITLSAVEDVDAREAASLSFLGTGGPNEVIGSQRGDDIQTRGGADTIDARSGKDDVASGAGADHVLGGNSDDTIHGGAGDDVLDGQDGADSIDGGGGRDSCSGETETNCES